jgi:hypothetical protein
MTYLAEGADSTLGIGWGGAVGAERIDLILRRTASMRWSRVDEIEG